MKTKEYIGSSPYGEDCTQVGSENYSSRATKECNAFIAQIRRVYGNESDNGCRLVVAGNSHDFGTYYSVDLEYDDNDDNGLQYFLDVEGDKLDGLEYWDDIAKNELGIS